MPRAQAHRRAWLGWLGVCGVGLVALAGGLATAAESGRAAAGVEAPDGGELYQRWCAACHATDGAGTTAGPPLTGIDVAYVDLTMRTGRMPLEDPARGVRQRRFSDAERRRTVAYLTDLLDLDGQVPDVAPGSPAAGRRVYGVHCAACHGPGGSGGLAGDGTPVPEIVGLDAVAIAEATRQGPFQMPRFGRDLISDGEVGDLAAFLGEDTHPPATPLGYTELSRPLAAAFATTLALVVIGLCVWASRRPGLPPHTSRERR